MKQSPRPSYWLLDLFVLLMIGLLFLIMLAGLSPGWETAAEVAWASLTIAGMSIWVRLNWSAFEHEERMQRQRAARSTNVGERTLPLTQVQERFLTVIERPEREGRQR